MFIDGGLFKELTWLNILGLHPYTHGYWISIRIRKSNTVNIHFCTITCFLKTALVREGGINEWHFIEVSIGVNQAGGKTNICKVLVVDFL